MFVFNFGFLSRTLIADRLYCLLSELKERCFLTMIVKRFMGGCLIIVVSAAHTFRVYNCVNLWNKTTPRTLRFTKHPPQDTLWTEFQSKRIRGSNINQAANIGVITIVSRQTIWKYLEGGRKEQASTFHLITCVF